VISIRILAILVITCNLLSAGCNSEKSEYDVGVAAYKRGHYQVAMSDFDKRANQRDPVAEFCLGFMYKNGKGVAKDTEEAKEWYGRAIRRNYAPALNNRGVMYVRRHESIVRELPEFAEEQITKAVKFIREAAEQGNPTAQYNLGILINRGYGEDSGTKTAAEWIKLAASQGYVPAQNKLAHLYQNGLWGVEKHLANAVEWYTQAATSDWRGKSYPLAQYNLATMYYYGEGVTQDFETAINWFLDATSQGLPSAQYFTGLMYHNGEGFAKNLKKTIDWYTKASKQGSAPAQFALARMYDKGDGVPKNSEKAIRFAFKAAQQGYAAAQYYLGQAFENGLDEVPQDNVEAYYWYSLAAKNTNELDRSRENIRVEAKLLLDSVMLGSVKRKLTENQKKEIDALVKVWTPKTLISRGTGFYVDENHILANRHVVRATFNEARIPFRRVKISVIASDNEDDLALLTDPRKNEITATFRRNPVDVGEEIILFGYPESNHLSYKGNSTSGIVSGISGIMTDFNPANEFQHTAPAQDGNSGSPIFDLAGNVVGINVSQLVDYRSLKGLQIIEINPPQNVNFAIKFNVVEAFLRKNGITGYATTKSSGKVIDLSEIYKQARKFTVPVLCYKDKDEQPLPVEEVNIEELEH
jgi:TPR repeat protein